VPTRPQLKHGVLTTKSSAKVHEVIQAEETRHVLGITPAAAESGQLSVVTSAAEVGGDPTAVMKVALMTC
jgi:hypothetical protein